MFVESVEVLHLGEEAIFGLRDSFRVFHTNDLFINVQVNYIDARGKLYLSKQ